MNKPSRTGPSPATRRRIRLPRRSLREWGCFMDALLSLTLAQLAVRFVPFGRISRRLGIPNAESPGMNPRHLDASLGLVSWALDAAARRLPWKCTCLVRALAAHAMLHRRRIPSTLYLGVQPDADRAPRLSAHAWLRSGESYVTGGVEREAFTSVASFADFVVQANRAS